MVSQDALPYSAILRSHTFFFFFFGLNAKIIIELSLIHSVGRLQITSYPI